MCSDSSTRRRFHNYSTAGKDSPGFPGYKHTRKRVPAAHPTAGSSSTIHMVLCKVTSCCTLTWRYLSLSLKSPIFPGCLGNSCPFWVLLQRLSREIPVRSLAIPLTAPELSSYRCLAPAGFSRRKTTPPAPAQHLPTDFNTSHSIRGRHDER